MTKILLPCGRGTTIDIDDMALIENLNLFSEKRGRTWYVRLRKPGHNFSGAYLHNVILGSRADHRDGDGLNNARSNLRPCTAAQNTLNRSAKVGKRFKGVYPSGRKFYAQIYLNREAYTEHGFATPEQAALAYDRMALKLHGEFACLNFQSTLHPNIRFLVGDRQAELFNA